MFEFIKKNKFLIIVIAVLLVLILMRSTGMNHFSTDARKWAEPSLKRINTIALEKLGDLKGSNLIINLGEGNDSLFVGINGKVRNISAESVLSKENIRTIMKYDGQVLIYSTDPGLSAKIWMLLSQMGRKDLYILMSETDNEILKYKLKADSLTY